MRRLYRICHQRFAATALDGEGARLVGGRWNAPGTRVVYASESIALATLETLVHAPPGLLVQAGLVIVSLELPDDASSEDLDAATLPPNWRDYPAPAALADLGTTWARERRTLLLRVPSAVIPAEWNVLVNPAHPEVASVRIGAVKPFDVDPRLRR